MNRRIVKKLGGHGGALSFLRDGTEVIGGSAAIIDWGNARAAPAPSLAGEAPQQVAEIEQRLDSVTGVHVRRYYYSDALFTQPQSVRPIFSRDMPLMQ